MILRWFSRLFDEHKFARRGTLIWAIIINTIVLDRATQPEVLIAIGAAGASVVASVTAIITGVIAFYQWSRGHDDATRTDWYKNEAEHYKEELARLQAQRPHDDTA